MPPSSAPPATVTRWLERFERHERAVVAAALAPSERSIRVALVKDPMVLPALVDTACDAVCRQSLRQAVAAGATESV